MQIIKPSYEVISLLNGNEILEAIERAGRTAYKSEHKITDTSAEKFVRGLIKRGHESVIEHCGFSVRFICDRGVANEIVRHRLASYTQSSTRYCKSVDKTSLQVLNEQDIVELYEEGFTMLKISELSKGLFSESDVLNTLKKNKIKRRPNGSLGVTNEDYFNIIDTPEKAYLLGIIATDGCVRLSRTKGALTITQHKNAYWYLETMLREFIRPSIKPYKDKECYALCINSKKLVQDLIGKGIIPNKTYKSGKEEADLLWSAIPEEFKWDFLRGHLDGNGSYRFFRQANPAKTFSCNISWAGTEALLLKIQQYLVDNFNYHAKVVLVSGTSCLYRLAITKPDIGIQVTEKLYKNFRFPYTHPAKATRVFEVIEWNKQIAEWGDAKFKVIKPCYYFSNLTRQTWLWVEAMDRAELAYSKLIKLGAKPEEARSVLPLSLETELIMTANLREWRHFFKLRTAKQAHPQMRELTIPLLKEIQGIIPVIFDDILVDKVDVDNISLEEDIKHV